ncbi:MAG: TrmB family transcriptional regulator [Candidatus Lokiarchaeota archaeon]|nr:TrmB family transcriptional regulator [Candidatus Lokiarchaeota archaeon]
MSKETPDNIKHALKAIGLTDYEVAIYLTLISKGPMDARELSDASGVPYSRIYNILTQLEKEKKFLHKEEESRPSRYFPKSPDEALIIAKKQYGVRFDKFSDEILRYLTPIYESHDSPIKVSLYIHRGRDICINRSLNLIDHARHSLYLVAPYYEFLDLFYEELKKARARGVTDIRLLIEENALKDEKFEELIKKYSEISEIRSRDQVFGTSIVMDEGEEAFIVLTQEIFKGLSYFGVATDHVAFGPASNFYFSYLYETAKPLKFE